MPEGTSRSAWYAVRCVFVESENKPWGPTDLTSGEASYEERITLWQAESSIARRTWNRAWLPSSVLTRRIVNRS